MERPTIEEINDARAIIYSHVTNYTLRNALYSVLNTIEDKIEASISGNEDM